MIKSLNEISQTKPGVWRKMSISSEQPNESQWPTRKRDKKIRKIHKTKRVTMTGQQMVKQNDVEEKEWQMGKRWQNDENVSDQKG